MAKSVALEERNAAIASLECQIKYCFDEAIKGNLNQELLKLHKTPLDCEIDLPQLPEQGPSAPLTSPATPSSAALQEGATTPATSTTTSAHPDAAAQITPNNVRIIEMEPPE